MIAHRTSQAHYQSMAKTNCPHTNVSLKQTHELRVTGRLAASNELGHVGFDRGCAEPVKLCEGVGNRGCASAADFLAKPSGWISQVASGRGSGGERSRLRAVCAWCGALPGRQCHFPATAGPPRQMSFMFDLVAPLIRLRIPSRVHSSLPDDAVCHLKSRTRRRPVRGPLTRRPAGGREREQDAVPLM